MIGLCLVAIISFTDASVLYTGDPYIIKPCNEGAIIENECVQCLCSGSHVYKCTAKNATVCDEDDANSSCYSNMMYELNDTVCICNNTGQWPNAKCNRVFKSFNNKVGVNCKPGSYVNSDCNVCKCGPDGKLNTARCTKNKCDNVKSKSFNSRRISNVYGNCEVSNWYSLAPCQFCFCVNENKLVCNTGHTYAQKLQLGAYNLSICGKELIREAVELIPENQKPLRDGVVNRTIENPADTMQTALSQHNVEINVNREANTVRFDANNSENVDDEYYTDSEEVPPKHIARESESMPIPYSSSIVKQESPKTKQEDEQDFESDNDMGVAIELPKRGKIVEEMKIESKPSSRVKKVESDVSKKAPALKVQESKIPSNFNLAEALKMNLPMVLDKVFQMALRKSMVTVESENKCTPGAATILKCNVCFCMTEHKLLCTNNACT